MAIEEPEFKLKLKDEAFEIRHYPALVVAEVTVNAERSQAMSEGFSDLAAYIFGANQQKQKLSMTTPVVQVPQKLDMTAPVTQTETQTQLGDSFIVRFMMPKAYSLEQLPRPDNPNIRLRTLPATTYGVVRFSGLTGAQDVAKQTQVLTQFVQKHKLKMTGDVTIARYDPPWTAWFMRRNEVMVPIESTP
jgi:uncharacterized protein YfdQ (DUF2303 family)